MRVRVRVCGRVLTGGGEREAVVDAGALRVGVQFDAVLLVAVDSRQLPAECRADLRRRVVEYRT